MLPLSHKSLRVSALLTCLLIPASAPAEEPITPPSVSSHIQPLLPQSIAHYRIVEPKAEYIVRVDTYGRALEAVCIEADHPALIERGINTITTARFNPAMEGDTPLIADLRLIIHFNNPALMQGNAMTQNGLDHIENSAFTPSVEKFKYRLSTVKELDSPLRVRSQGEVFHPVDDDGNILQGNAVVEVYIDHEGVPRLPKIIRSDDPAISAASLESLSTWRFAKPTAASQPTAVKARIPFHYNKPDQATNTPVR